MLESNNYELVAIKGLYDYLLYDFSAAIHILAYAEECTRMYIAQFKSARMMTELRV